MGFLSTVPRITPCKPWVQNNCFKMTLLRHLHLCQDWKGTKISKENMDFRSITCFLCNPSFQVSKLYEPMTENITLCVILKSSLDREKAKHPSILLEEPQEKLSRSFSPDFKSFATIYLWDLLFMSLGRCHEVSPGRSSAGHSVCTSPSIHPHSLLINHQQQVS